MNWRSGSCSPMPYHLAMSPNEKIIYDSKTSVKQSLADISYVPSKLHTDSEFLFLGQAFDRLVTVSSMHYCTSTSALSTLYSSRDLMSFTDGISHLEGGFTLRCLQRLSLPDLATQRCHWLTAGTPVVRPTRSSRTRVSSPQISSARAG